MADAASNPADPERAKRPLFAFLRVLGLALVCLGLYRWAVVLGIAGSAEGLAGMEENAQIALAGLAIFDLVSGVGVWLLAPWGTVVWLITAAAEIGVRLVIPDDVGPDWPAVAFHAVALLLYLALAGRLELRRWRLRAANR